MSDRDWVRGAPEWCRVLETLFEYQPGRICPITSCGGPHAPPVASVDAYGRKLSERK